MEIETSQLVVEGSGQEEQDIVQPHLGERKETISSMVEWGHPYQFTGVTFEKQHL